MRRGPGGGRLSLPAALAAAAAAELRGLVTDRTPPPTADGVPPLPLLSTDKRDSDPCRTGGKGDSGREDGRLKSPSPSPPSSTSVMVDSHEDPSNPTPTSGPRRLAAAAVATAAARIAAASNTSKSSSAGLPRSPASSDKSLLSTGLGGGGGGRDTWLRLLPGGAVPEEAAGAITRGGGPGGRLAGVGDGTAARPAKVAAADVALTSLLPNRARRVGMREAMGLRAPAGATFCTCKRPKFRISRRNSIMNTCGRTHRPRRGSGDAA